MKTEYAIFSEEGKVLQDGFSSKSTAEAAAAIDFAGERVFVGIACPCGRGVGDPCGQCQEDLDRDWEAMIMHCPDIYDEDRYGDLDD